MKRNLLTICICVFLAFTFASPLGLGAHKHMDKKEEDGPAAQLSKAPPSAHAAKNPYSDDKDSAAAGEKLFRKNCVECHGPDGQGTGHAADLRSPVIQNAAPGVLFWAIQNGRPNKGMPPWSGLKDDQIWEIITFIRTLRK